ncbi:hypothetical protein NC99_01230 [Sunxiuqinia dokdonensis]|uniref:Uncharacterized protein n=1 Tax=Sunxiuqinia dokdonensis TaxID=1409788 RepID=A0A0L8VF28_9BACT|nr:hypothetical protein NC99_01230 [Sunxiuqinia dokdonensis]
MNFKPAFVLLPVKIVYRKVGRFSFGKEANFDQDKLEITTHEEL